MTYWIIKGRSDCWLVAAEPGHSLLMPTASKGLIPSTQNLDQTPIIGRTNEQIIGVISGATAPEM